MVTSHTPQPPAGLDKVPVMGIDDAFVRVVSFRQLAWALGISVRTLTRLERAGDIPRKTRLSPNRIGFRIADVRSWLDARVLP